ncbi:hypothetical protein [uncultured Campylobacter sp.]|uniref:hypothetical protein n=1 Tax=uncultured Campylobacter sp. TaxID=218934 RepID=UPI0026048BE0|nr:hypothetical protein [uncultured Campylobacter sp.]
MENFENWNKNVKKRDLNSNENANLNDFNKRDYDKEPIVIKNPYEFFLKNLDLFCFIGAFVILSTACIDYTDNIHKKEIKILLYFPFVFVILHIIWAFYYYIIKNKCETKFTNKTIEFIINGEVKRVKNLIDLGPVTRNFKLSYSLGVYFHLFLFFFDYFNFN